jgi:hypothetical protein
MQRLTLSSSTACCPDWLVVVDGWLLHGLGDVVVGASIETHPGDPRGVESFSVIFIFLVCGFAPLGVRKDEGSPCMVV